MSRNSLKRKVLLYSSLFFGNENVVNQKICKKECLSWVYGVDRKICHSGSLFDITRQAGSSVRLEPADHAVKIQLSSPFEVVIFSIINRIPLLTALIITLPSSRYDLKKKTVKTEKL